MQNELPLNDQRAMVINSDKPYKIYADYVEYEALKQFEAAMQLDCVVKGALMPDAHAGYTLPIGGVVATKGMVFPSFVGFDIGCGVFACRLLYVSPEEIASKQDEIYEAIYDAVPVGFKNNSEASRVVGLDECDLSPYGKKAFNSRGGFHALGSLGGGNHFIEIGYDEENYVWVIVHSGSRGPGHGIATEFMRLASPTGKASEGHFGFADKSQLGKDYINDMGWALSFALENRKIIASRVIQVIRKFFPDTESRWDMYINRNHNHAEYRNKLWIHRKGATHAEDGMLGVIPGSMKQGAFIVMGKGNPDSLWSSSHGAGRVMSRGKAKEKLSLEDFKAEMVGIKAKVEQSTLDESDGAYKDIHMVMEQQKDLVDVLHYVKPIINVKG